MLFWTLPSVGRGAAPDLSVVQALILVFCGFPTWTRVEKEAVLVPATRWPHFSASELSSCPHDYSSPHGVLQPPIAGAPVAPLASNDHHGGICPCRFALRRRTSHYPGGPAVSRGYPYLLRSTFLSPGHLVLPGTSCSRSFWPKMALLGSCTGFALLFTAVRASTRSFWVSPSSSSPLGLPPRSSSGSGLRPLLLRSGFHT